MKPSPLHEPLLDEDVLRPTHVEVDLDALEHNLLAIRERVGPSEVMPVLKANAYGHGLVPVARRMEALGVPCIGLAFLEEGIRLRRAGVRTPILVLGGVLGDQIPLFLQHDLMLAASSVDKLLLIEQHAAEQGIRARVHLKVDTGMERIGIHWYHADRLLEASLRCAHVDVVGIYSHLAQSDERDPSFTRLQLERFEEVLSFYEERSLPVPTRHLANSGAILGHPPTWLDMVRPGLILYGAWPSDVRVDLDLRPALRWVSRVVYFKVVEPGAGVSYGSTWAPDRQTRIVTIPVGYGDGYPRALSSRGQVLIRGKRYPIVGRVCMDQIMVDIGWDSAWNGDEVVLLGADEHGHRIATEELAAWAGTIPWEILTNINTRVQRVTRG
ncbi:MAG: alanine racemase [Myxococcales bacterium]|nr:alanine racemase [Myxococcales bacterium]